MIYQSQRGDKCREKRTQGMMDDEEAYQSTGNGDSSDNRQKDTPPTYFCCPLTLDVMMDPVLDREGNTFEREAVVAWLQKNKTSPISREPLNESMLVPNIALREMISSYMGPIWVAKQERAASRRKKQCSGITGRKRRPFSHSCAYRQKVDNFLRDISASFGTDLYLNKHGMVSFKYEEFTVCLEVPESNGSFFLYTSEQVSDLTSETKDKLLSLNYLQQETRGGCLSVQKTSFGSEILFSYMDRVFELSAQDFQNILENFIDTTTKLRKQILPNDHESDKRDGEDSKQV
eukprot:CAMPEP_0195293276 /NCGR_PEP_ID=MMETSP0707-20130614/12087_1 /TAXON_ID=33640 /ORGANISM="Asterionellopsis glacialis, Strain CCMP134" /LENGTH=289 /DNA_ID=CAMNT_0040353953 /DNA_START=202 /DNA_END=1071 /DNA_ORIENTATION=+